MEKRRTLGRFGTVLALAVIPTLGNSALGQAGIEAPIILPQVRTNPLSPHTLSFPSSKGEMGPPRLRLNFTGLLEDDSGPSSRPDRFQLFRMPTGFLSTPVGLDTDDDDSSENPTLTSPGTGQDRIQVAVGQDNPFFDFRYRGDPGGYGYYRLHAQYQLVDSNGGGLSLGTSSSYSCRFGGGWRGSRTHHPQSGFGLVSGFRKQFCDTWIRGQECSRDFQLDG